MYVGHFATGIAIKAIRPKTPTLPILMGVAIMDLLDGIFILIGIDQVTPNLASGPYLFFDLTFIDWDHSLLMAIIISVVWGSLFLKDRVTALIAAIATFSHFLLDLPVHNGDLAIYPRSSRHLGYGLWGKLGTLSWILEGLFVVALVAFAWPRLRKGGINLKWPAVVLAILFFNTSPWLSPMKWIARQPMPAASLISGAVGGIGFIVPGLLLTYLIDRAQKKTDPARERPAT